jgi:acetyl/propionyl-CoA carboxylase alpha subunit
MLAKLIAHGADRTEALDRLRSALDDTTLLGVRTNVRFLRWLLDQPAMRDGEMRTDTIAGMAVPPAPPVEDRHWRAAAPHAAPPRSGLWDDGWRMNAPRALRLRHDDDERSVGFDADPDGLPVAAADASGTVHVDVDGQSLEFELAPPPTVEEAVRHASAHAGTGSAPLTAPMPGRVIAVRATEGATVAAHQPIVVIEAMKMEHAVVAPIDGTVTRLLVAEGQQVQRGDLLGEVGESTA